MSEQAAPVQPGTEAAAAAGGDEAQQQAWETIMKQGVLPGMAGFPMAAFAGQGAPFLPYGAFMLPGMMGGAFGVADGEGGKAEGEEGGEDDDTEDDGGDDDEDDYSSGKEGGRPKRKRATRGSARKKGDADAKSTSTALAMLASAAGTKPGVPGVINPAAAAMQQSIEGMWALNGAAGGMPTTGSQLDLSKLTTAEQQQLLAAGEYTGITDERELKRLRRKQSNRESARRSRLRKQAECEQLAQKVKELASENARLKEEKMQLVAQIEILNAKLSMSAFGAMQTLGGAHGDQAKQVQDMQSMAAAMAQAMQVNGGAMLGAGFAIPSLDASALEGKSPEEAAALATAAAAAAAAATGEPLQVAQPEQPQS
ncbi:hypothetical protein ABPG77_000486 [Micractinium sp. CCAP 211/92]